MTKVSADTDPLYKGWVKNVKDLKKAKSNLHRIINRQVKAGKIPDKGLFASHDLEIISNLSKSAFLIYSSYTEASLLKLIHLPNSFTSDEVEQILNKKDFKIIDAWIEAITIAAEKNSSTIVGGITKEACKLELENIAKLYLEEPSKIRNKLAHGQWVSAFSRKFNPSTEYTSKILSIDIVKIEVWYKIFDKFSELLKQLIQSPNKGFPVQYSLLIDDIKSFAVESQGWNLMSKRAKLLKMGPIQKQENTKD